MIESKRGVREDGVRWGLVLLAGLWVALSTYLLQQLIVYLYVFGPRFVESSVLGPLLPSPEPPGAGRAARFGEIVGLYVMPALHLLLVIASASWIGRRIGKSAALHGVLVGVVAALANQMLGLSYGALVTQELVVYPVLGVAGGILGGLRGWNVRAGEEALHEVSRAVGAASSPDEIAAAVGERLAGSKVNGVSLWRRTVSGGQDLDLAGWWSPRGSGSYLTEVRPDAVRAPEKGNVPRRLTPGELPEADRDVWRLLGVRAALVVPLDSTPEARGGVLMVTSRQAGGFSSPDRRAYSTAAAGVGLALENLRLLEEARQAATVRERQRMAHEIHDTLAQGFTSIVMNAQAAEAGLDRDPASLREHLGHIERTARESLTEARRLVWALRPERLTRDSPGEALGKLASVWSRESGVEAGFEVVGEELPLPAAAEETLLRTAQEALSNVRKHAGASRAALTLSYLGEKVMLDVRDDGIGFDPGAPRGDPSGKTNGKTNGESSGFGLAGLHERAERAGGTLAVESAPGEGTTIALDLPSNTSPARQSRHPEITEEAR